MGLGAVTHTLNPRLSDRDIKWIANDAKASAPLCAGRLPVPC
jgi:hypothetical protein